MDILANIAITLGGQLVLALVGVTIDKAYQDHTVTYPTHQEQPAATAPKKGASHKD